MVFSNMAYAGSVMNSNTSTTTPTTTTNSGLGDAALVRNNEIPMAQTPQLTATQGLQQNGQNAANKQNAGQMAALASAAFSAALAAATCSQKPPPPTCPMAIMGALAGLAMAGMMGAAKNKSNAQVSGVTSGSSTTPQETAANRETAETKRKLAAAAKSAGVSVDTDKGTARLADGRSLSLNDMQSQSSMSSAGLKPGEIKAFGDIMKEAGKKGDIAMKAQDGDPNGGGMDGGGGVTAVYGSSGGGGGGDTARRSPASVSGAVRDYNGTPIGVSVDSIWTMMNRRYAHEVDNKKLSN